MRVISRVLVAGLVAFAACSGGGERAPVSPEPPAAAADADDGAVAVAETCSVPAEWISDAVLVVEPGRAAGAVCAFGSQCVSGLCSADGAVTGACGVCLERRRLGERCDGPLQGCAHSAACAQGTCVSKKKLVGEPCRVQPKGGDLFDCDDELYCDPVSGGSSFASAPRCAPRIAATGACGSFGACVRGASCRREVCVADSERSCLDLPCPGGAACTSSPDGGAACQPVTLPGAGEACLYGWCAAGLTCAERQSADAGAPRERRCRSLSLEGEACTSYFGYGPDELVQFSTCAPGLECRKGRCERPCGG